MTDSRIAQKSIPAYAGNYTKNRAAQGGKISEITVHHCAADIGVEALGALWQRRGRKGSSHYGVHGTACAQYVAEKDVAWTNSNWASNCRAVTIEVANDGGAPDWHVSDASLETLTRLVADIARRNGLHPLVPGKTLTWHSMYAPTACPGPYLLGRLRAVCDGANALNGAKPLSDAPVTLLVGPASAGDRNTMRALAQRLALNFDEQADGTLRIGPASRGDQVTVLAEASALGLPAKAEEAAAQALYIVQAGVFSSLERAEAFAGQCERKGVPVIVKKKE